MSFDCAQISEINVKRIFCNFAQFCPKSAKEIVPANSGLEAKLGLVETRHSKCLAKTGFSIRFSRQDGRQTNRGEQHFEVQLLQIESCENSRPRAGPLGQILPHVKKMKKADDVINNFKSTIRE